MKLHSYKGLLVLGMLTAIAMVATFSTSGNAKADEVPTHGVVSTTGSGPVIECKWELPDMDSATAGIQYTAPLPVTHAHDDDSTIVPDRDNDATNGTQ
ncbi:MAG: hypothetical protein HY873_02645, partial [Chloroflexi bacterium]|nr:hypothetical protein [Chloroflexota bacterium]